MFDGDFVHVLLGAVALYATDLILEPMFGYDTMTRWVKLIIQAYVLKLTYTNVIKGWGSS